MINYCALTMHGRAYVQVLFDVQQRKENQYHASTTGLLSTKSSSLESNSMYTTRPVQ